jgi:Domain of unknown function (DUF4349)
MGLAKRSDLFGALFVGSLLLVVGGCEGSSHDSTAKSIHVERTPLQRPLPTNTDSLTTREATKSNLAFDLDSPQETGIDSTLPTPELTLNQKIIYTARLSVVVENFENIPVQVANIVGQFGGYISEANIGERTGTQRTGTWKIRVPSQRYRQFLDSAEGLGVSQSLTEHAEDVSEKYIDLEARIDNTRLLEAQVAKILEKQDAKLENMIALEKELARVRLEIEQLEGAMRLMTNQIAFSTVDLSIEERKAFVPAQPMTFDDRIKNEWSDALAQLRRCGESIAIFFVANTFIIAALVLGTLIAWPIFRTITRRWRKALAT